MGKAMTTGAESWCRRGHYSGAQLYRRVKGNRIASDNVVCEREVLSLDEHARSFWMMREVLILDERAWNVVNAHTRASQRNRHSKGVLCAPRRPNYDHTRKGALIQRDKDNMPNPRMTRTGNYMSKWDIWTAIMRCEIVNARQRSDCIINY